MKTHNAGVFIDSDSATSDWYTGSVGYFMTDAKPLPFYPCNGRLGFFNVDYPGELS